MQPLISEVSIGILTVGLVTIGIISKWKRNHNPNGKPVTDKLCMERQANLIQRLDRLKQDVQEIKGMLQSKEGGG
jgi:hypothetical protein